MFQSRLISFALRLSLVGVCLYSFHVFLADAHWQDALAHIATIPVGNIIIAVCATICSYLALIGYDYLGCRYVNADVKLPSIAATACMANAISNMVGFALLSGGAVRMRCYSAAGVPLGSIAKISMFCTATFLLGLMLTASFGLIFDGMFFAIFTGLSMDVLQYSGIGLLVLCLGLSVAAHFWRDVQWRGQTLALPSPAIMWGQYLVGLVDILAAGTVLYIMLPAGGVDFFAFIALYSAALWLGVVSHVPGGIGVFEAVMLAGLSSMMPSGEALGALLLYRIVYYIVPFATAACVLVLSELRSVAGQIKTKAPVSTRLLLKLPAYFMPVLLAGMTALAGIVLLISGATPAATGRVYFLADYVPLGLIEGSHLMGSMIGLALLIVARGIYYRYDSAYATTLALLVSGIVFSLIKGFDYEEALLLGSILPFVALSRRMFYRPTRISMMEIGGGWWLFIACTLAGIVWLLFFAYKHVDYDNYLWWQIALGDQGDASRSLRSTLMLCLVVSVIGLHQMFRPSKPLVDAPNDTELAKAWQIIAKTSTTTAFLAMTGDKYLLFSENNDAFIMFGQTSRSVIAMGDPVGNPESFPALIWQLHELADRHRRRLAFYQVSTEFLPGYIDSGAQFARLGEEALIDLKDFSLQGGRYRGMRQNLAKGEREQLEFTMVQPAEIAAIEPALHAVSSLWLANKNTREKSFSLGHYDANYIKRFPAAIVRHQGEIVAFANIWACDNKDELSIDLMRHTPEAPAGTMDYLFVKLLIWGKENNYKFFNMGMAPLAGFNSHRLAPFWTKLGSFIFMHSERFYNFQGIHSFKAKYHPVWRPRYLAYTGGSGFFILLDVAILIAGSFKGLFRK